MWSLSKKESTNIERINHIETKNLLKSIIWVEHYPAGVYFFKCKYNELCSDSQNTQ